MGNYLEEQQRNRREASEHISKWVDCFMKADEKNKDMLGRDLMEIIMAKSKMNPYVNRQISQALEMVNLLRQF